MNKQVEANLSMVVSKALGGLNMNALKYLLPFISRKTKCSAFTKHFVPESHLLTQIKM